MVERKDTQALVGRGLDRETFRRGRTWSCPQGLIQRVAANRTLVGDGCLVAHQPEQQRTDARLSGGVERPLEGDHPVGERACLVGEQNLDVAQILDRNQTLHQHPLLHERPRTSGETHGHDGRHHLGSDTDRDRQRKKERVDERSGQRDVHDKNERRENRGDSEQETRKACQACLERGRRLLLGQAFRDLPERRTSPGPNHHT